MFHFLVSFGGLAAIALIVIAVLVNVRTPREDKAATREMVAIKRATGEFLAAKPSPPSFLTRFFSRRRTKKPSIIATITDTHRRRPRPSAPRSSFVRPPKLGREMPRKPTIPASSR